MTSAAADYLGTQSGNFDKNGIANATMPQKDLQLRKQNFQQGPAQFNCKTQVFAILYTWIGRNLCRYNVKQKHLPINTSGGIKINDIGNGYCDYNIEYRQVKYFPKLESPKFHHCFLRKTGCLLDFNKFLLTKKQKQKQKTPMRGDLRAKYSENAVRLLFMEASARHHRSFLLARNKL
jgi:hypothetical protein